MKKTINIIVHLLFLNSYSQTKGDIIDRMINGVGFKSIKGIEQNGAILSDAINENNTLVYIYKVVNKESVNAFRNYQSKQNFINQSPNSLSRLAKKYNFICKWRYYYKNKIFLEIKLSPPEWNN